MLRDLALTATVFVAVDSCCRYRVYGISRYFMPVMVAALKAIHISCGMPGGIGRMNCNRALLIIMACPHTTLNKINPAVSLPAYMRFRSDIFLLSLSPLSVTNSLSQ